MALILIVDDEPKLRALLAMALSAEGLETREADSAEAALEALARGDDFSALITDVRMPGMSGLELVKRVRQERPHLECIVMTAYADAGTGVEAMRTAPEYVLKPFEMDEMTLLVRSAVEKSRLRDEVAELRVRETDRWRMDNIIGDSKPIQDAIRQARMVAKRDTTVLSRARPAPARS